MIRPLTLGDPFLLPIQNVALVISGFARNGCQTSNVRASCVLSVSQLSSVRFYRGRKGDLPADSVIHRQCR